MTSRRQFISQVACLSGASAAARFGLNQAHAAALEPGRRFVFFYVVGGWDQLLYFDPREQQGDIDATNIEPDYKVFNTPYGGGPHFTGRVYRPLREAPNFTFGPGVVSTTGPGNGIPVTGPSLVSLAADGVPMAMVRGLNMGTLGHEPGLLYIITGEPAQGNAGVGVSMPIRIADQLGAHQMSAPLVPVLSLSVESFAGNKPGRYGAFQMSSIEDARRLLSRGETLVQTAEVERQLAQRRMKKLQRAKGLAAQLIASQQQAQEMLAAGVNEKIDVLGSTSPEMVAVRAHYGLQAGASSNTSEAVAAFAAQAVKQSLAQFISVKFPVGCDTHGSKGTLHANLLSPVMRALPLFLEDLRKSPAPGGGTWLDKTTVVVFSEFARTPRYNMTGGRDHHFTSSCLLAGAGIRNGAVVGASSVVGGMQPVPYDFENQALLPETYASYTALKRHIKPQDVGATLLACAGASWSEYRDATPLWPLLTRAPFTP